VDVGGALRVEKDDLILAVFNVDGEFFVTDDACTHGPGSLSE
jgi:nitrite reductase/ring-hydroxylating ferredoxin subunit